MKKTVGNFKGEVWDPYPCQCTISSQGTEIRFTHKDLADLTYLIKAMRKTAKHSLGKDKGEV